MIHIQTPIIPTTPTYIGEGKTWHKEAICIFMATGFFLDQDTFYHEVKALQPARDYLLEGNKVIDAKAYFKWHYNPVDRPLDQIVAEFANLYEQIISEQVGDKTVILPLSGGLDSRTQAVALHYLGKKVNSYSYTFQDGHDETYYADKIAKESGFAFQRKIVPAGYLWNCIEELAKINGCFSEFTHPRQMAFKQEYASLGDVFSLGHWGDVLFDDMGVADNLSIQDQVEVIVKKIIKRDGLAFAQSLWEAWELEANFEKYLKQRILDLLKDINIPHSANAQIRAFKSLYWAPRWTSVNLSVFESVKPITLPYYDNRMCEFICTVPEKYLTGRQIQIAYIKKRMPEVARITWQDHRPFNLYTYQWNKLPWNLPYKVIRKLNSILFQEKIIQRNWELQFLGVENQKQLDKYVLESEALAQLVPKSVIEKFTKKFKEDNALQYAHPMSMLLTLSLFLKIQNHE